MYHQWVCITPHVSRSAHGVRVQHMCSTCAAQCSMCSTYVVECSSSSSAHGMRVQHMCSTCAVVVVVLHMVCICSTCVVQCSGSSTKQVYMHQSLGHHVTI
jgi:hypothetical protein